MQLNSQDMIKTVPCHKKNSCSLILNSLSHKIQLIFGTCMPTDSQSPHRIFRMFLLNKTFGGQSTHSSRPWDKIRPPALFLFCGKNELRHHLQLRNSDCWGPTHCTTAGLGAVGTEARLRKPAHRRGSGGLCCESFFELLGCRGACQHCNYFARAVGSCQV